MVEKVFGHV